MRFKNVFIFAISTLLISKTLLGTPPRDCGERVIVMGSEVNYVLTLKRDKLTLDTIVLAEDSSYKINNCSYKYDLHSVERRYKNLDIKNNLTVKNDNIYYNSQKIQLPDGIKARDIWQAIIWGNWVICLGRTSNTDASAKLTPPFFASELICFNVNKKSASVKYISPSAPTAIGIWVLSPQ